MLLSIQMKHPATRIIFVLQVIFVSCKKSQGEEKDEKCFEGFTNFWYLDGYQNYKVRGLDPFYLSIEHRVRHQ